MSDTPPSSNAKIYPRPDRVAPSPWLLVLIALALLLVSFFAYRAYTQRAVAPAAQAAPVGR
ncbi:MAG: hypothetical protein QM758_01330 [Armatimonas sp.]